MSTDIPFILDALQSSNTVEVEVILLFLVQLFTIYCMLAGVDRAKVLINSRIQFVALNTFTPKLNTDVFYSSCLSLILILGLGVGCFKCLCHELCMDIFFEKYFGSNGMQFHVWEKFNSASFSVGVLVRSSVQNFPGPHKP